MMPIFFSSRLMLIVYKKNFPLLSNKTVQKMSDFLTTMYYFVAGDI